MVDTALNFLKMFWKICLINNITKSVFVIVNCLINRVEFYKKVDVLTFFFDFDLEMNLM